MFSFFKKKEPSLSFKQRVVLFWQLFTDNEEKIRASIKEGQGEKGVALINSIFRQSRIELAFQMGFNGQKFEFFFSPEGDKNIQFLTRCLIDISPQLPHWLFFPSKPGVSIEGLKSTAIAIDKHTQITPANTFILPILNEEQQKFDIAVYSECFTNLPEKDKFQLTFLILDEVLGEYGTEMFIGKIDFSSGRQPGDIDLITFRQRVDGYKVEIGFSEDTTPDQLRGVYSVKVQNTTSETLRSDVYVINTTHIDLFNHFKKPNLLQKFGAHYVFITMGMQLFNSENFLDQRDALSDKLDLEMQAGNDGFVVGYATGTINCYIDLIIFDGETSVEKLKNILHQYSGTLQGSIHYFEKEKQGQSQTF